MASLRKSDGGSNGMAFPCQLSLMVYRCTRRILPHPPPTTGHSSPVQLNLSAFEVLREVTSVVQVQNGLSFRDETASGDRPFSAQLDRHHISSSSSLYSARLYEHSP